MRRPLLSANRRGPGITTTHRRGQSPLAGEESLANQPFGSVATKGENGEANGQLFGLWLYGLWPVTGLWL